MRKSKAQQIIIPALLSALIGAAQAAPNPALRGLFDEAWERNARSAPEWATYRGDHRYNDRLADRSPAAIAADDAYARELLKRARTLEAAGLDEGEKVSLALFIERQENEVEFQAFEGYRTLSLGSLWGFQASLSGLLRQTPVNSEAEVQQLLRRLAAYPKRVEQEIARLRHGISLGWVSSRPVLERSLAQLDGQLSADPEKSPLFEPFTRLPESIPAARRAELRRLGLAAVREQVYPAQQALARFVREDYLPKAPANGALSSYPGGAAVYAALVRRNTTLALTPAEVHATGLAQVARLRGEMEAVRREVGFAGELPAFMKYLYSDPKFFHADGEALLNGYREIAKRIDPELPRLFAELPRAPYGIRAMPAYMGEGAAENYTAPTMDGSTAGWFNANALAFKRRPIWGMETLVVHETVPGHHLQLARQRELGTLPAFRRNLSYTAYSEGWALYAETLGKDLGLYKDPYSRFGHLQAQMFRAARLVVDTGLHALGWQRQQAIDYMLAQTGHDPVFIATEVDRYYASPGQALAYMTGQLKIQALRDKAQAALGERFDLRRFHMVLLDQGPLPLALLEQRVDAWIMAERKAG
ncbi:DUF885 domain-containing protein [Roseateles sp. DAIF2]|uniref:DUF885 domain-containing protein n=1 Tax=Roseateles sp. DAIF2 TaxID=2714952 RepID=UPI0018A27EFF|nr:DUF885 domain-containing protein [Roseateles sp. DAIF2]QPF75228.1 DUF885 domain-containing protein [Roseateles sp. DAIF2]